MRFFWKANNLCGFRRRCGKVSSLLIDVSHPKTFCRPLIPRLPFSLLWQALKFWAFEWELKSTRTLLSYLSELLQSNQPKWKCQVKIWWFILWYMSVIFFLTVCLTIWVLWNRWMTKICFLNLPWKFCFKQ